MKRHSTLGLTLIAGVLASAAFAQQPDATGGAIAASEPGKAAFASAAEISAQVIGLDKATRTLTLKGPEGKVFDVVAGEEVKNFDQIAVGDLVVARYVEALSLELRKAGTATSGINVSEEAARAKPGDKPGVGGVRQVTVVADVIGVDQAKSTITLKGPKGKTVTLDVKNPDHFKVVEVGDKVEVTYTEALALSVETAPAKKE